MAIAKRTHREASSYGDLLARGKKFTDASIELNIDEVLNRAKIKSKIAQSAAKLSGVTLQLEGDYNSQRLVYAAYAGIYDLMRPAQTTFGAEQAQEIFNQHTTRQTLLILSRTLNSIGFSKVAHYYAARGDYLELTDNGLEKQPDFHVPWRFETRNGGCPYAQTKDAPYFNQLTDRIVETYTTAHSSGMPHGWLDVVNHSLLRRT